MIHAKDINEHSPWQQLTPGCALYEPGTAAAFNTGDWRTATPTYHADRCKQCLLCAPYCPDCALCVKDGKLTGIEYMHCKGCGICAKVCPFGAITFEEEGK